MPYAVKSAFQVQGDNGCRELKVHSFGGLLLEQGDLLNSIPSLEVGGLLFRNEAVLQRVGGEPAGDQPLQQLGDVGCKAEGAVV